MSNEMYSVEQVAERLGLHVRTVRSYIRSGRLKAVRIGKQYRIARDDLAALTGQNPAPGPPADRAVEVSSIVQIEGVDRTDADRLATLVLAGANSSAGHASPLRIQTIHDDDRRRMKIVILGDAAGTADVLRLLDSVLGEGGNLLGAAANDG